MSKKLWVAYEALARRFGPTRVSIDGCSDVAHFKVAIRNRPLLDIPQNTPITLYKSDGTTEIKVGASPADYLEGNSVGNPLIVKSVVSSQVSSLQNSSCSKVSMVLQSTMTTEEKESILMEFLQSKEREVDLVLQSKDQELQSKEQLLQSKDQVLKSKEQELQSNIDLLELLKEKIKRIEAERDFLKGTLDARQIFETYESRFLNPYPQCPKLPRTEKWKKHLDLKPNVRRKLEEFDQKVLWHDEAAEIYDELCRSSYRRTIDVGNGTYIVVIDTSLSKTLSWFVKVLANELYGENVSVHKDRFVGPAYETEAPSV